MNFELGEAERGGKWGRRRRTAVETEGGGSDRNSLSMKKDREVERETDTVSQRDNEPQREERREMRGRGESL